MNRPAQELEEAVRSRTLIQIYRPAVDPYELLGYAVGLSDRLLMIQAVDGDCLALNGYTVVRRSQVKRWSADSSFVGRAHRLLGREPAEPEGIDLETWERLLASARDRYPLVSLELEKATPGTLYIGTILSLDLRAVTLRTVDTKAEWIEPESFPLRDLTRVAFGDGYSLALAAVMATLHS